MEQETDRAVIINTLTGILNGKKEKLSPEQAVLLTMIKVLTDLFAKHQNWITLVAFLLAVLAVQLFTGGT